MLKSLLKHEWSTKEKAVLRAKGLQVEHDALVPVDVGNLRGDVLWNDAPRWRKISCRRKKKEKEPQGLAYLR